MMRTRAPAPAVEVPAVPEPSELDALTARRDQLRGGLEQIASLESEWQTRLAAARATYDQAAEASGADRRPARALDLLGEGPRWSWIRLGREPESMATARTVIAALEETGASLSGARARIGAELAAVDTRIAAIEAAKLQAEDRRAKRLARERRLEEEAGGGDFSARAQRVLLALGLDDEPQ